MNIENIDDLIDRVKACVERHNLGNPGAYARWLWEDPRGKQKRDLGVNEYGCADAANILYTVGAFPGDPGERQSWIEILRGLQNPESGMFSEPTHHTIHTTAHCMAALELFDAKPLYPCAALKEYTEKEALYRLLEREVDWTHPWRESHKGAGIFVCLTCADMVDLQWKDWYFDWMWEHSDPETGFFLAGKTRCASAHEYMAGGFHYMFNHEAERRPYRYPEKIIDYCLMLLETPDRWGMLRSCNFIEVDVVYALNRALRQSPHRFAEAKAALEDFAEKYIAMMRRLDCEKEESFNDLHCLFGAMCCLAELQTALPGKIKTSKPLKLVLDRRPFI